MKKLFPALVIAILATTASSYGQAILKDTELLTSFENIPQEGIFVHQNAGVLFAGEQLYYSIYCLDLKSRKLSSLSKVGYVELVGADKQAVFRHKIRLADGRGQADFFIPASVPTGSYKLIGYTQWMKNGGQGHFFQSDLDIINPYQTIPVPYLAEKKHDSVNPDSTLDKPPQTLPEQTAVKQSGMNHISLRTEGSAFGKREKAEILLEGLDAGAIAGNYSLSIRKIDSLAHPVKLGSQSISTQYRKGHLSGSLRSKEAIVIPELRGELISGKVVSGAGGKPQPNQKVAVSLPGRDFVLDIANTNEEGIFYFNMDEPYNHTTGIFQLLGENKEDHQIIIDTHISPRYEDLEFNRFTLDEDLRPLILERSIHNQIENAYASERSDTIVAVQAQPPFYRNFQEKYDLDDYTRFNTIKETMVEIIDHVWIKNDDQGKSVFQVRPFDLYLSFNNLLPIVLMDGVFIRDHEDIMDYPSKRIRSVHISRDRYLVGSAIFQGILAIETITGDFGDSFYKSYLKNAALFKPQPAKLYFIQKYRGTEDEAHLPDFRYQLLWYPNLQLNGRQTAINFYTSDIPGEYEIRMEGFTSAGDPVSLKKTIRID